MTNQVTRSIVPSDPAVASPTRRRADDDPLAPVVTPPSSAAPWEQIDRALADRSVKFEPELEARHTADTHKDRLKVYYMAANWAPPAIGTLLLCDYFLVPDVWTMAVVMRLLGMAPYVMAAHFLRRSMDAGKLLEISSVVGVLSTALVHMVVVAHSRSPMAQSYLVGLAMIAMFGAAFLRLRFKPALLSMVAICVGGFVTNAILPEVQRNPVVGVPVTTLVLSACLFSLYALYHLEKDERRNYLLTLKQAMIRDDLQRTIGQIESMARVDPLTQLSNRRHFGSQLDRLWSRLQIDGSPVSVLLIDVDRFAQFNLDHGARLADACLHELAQSMQRCLRRPNDIVARHDDDEFVAVLSHTASEPASLVAQRILNAAQSLTMLPGSDVKFKVTVSVGVACLGSVTEFDSSEALFAMARHALQAAKRQGGNQMVVSWSERPVI